MLMMRPKSMYKALTITYVKYQGSSHGMLLLSSRFARMARIGRLVNENPFSMLALYAVDILYSRIPVLQSAMTLIALGNTGKPTADETGAVYVYAVQQA